MPWRDEDEDSDELEGSEYPDREDEEDEETVSCPYCQEAVYDDAVRCPHCGNYISKEDTPSRTPWWIVITAIICLLIVIGWILGRP